MAPGYREWLDQLRGITEYEGFMAALVDIRDSMVFYERDLMLAGYTGMVEGLMVSALAAACLEGDAQAEDASCRVREVVDGLPQALADPEAPADVQAVIEAFLRVGAWILRERLPVYVLAFSRYAHDDYDPEKRIDALVLEAEMCEAAEDHQQCLDRLGEVGALMLRGQVFRPRWIDVVPTRLQLALAGLRNMTSQLAATYPDFPWGPIQQERLRRPAPRVVVDMQAFRRRRLMAQDLWQGKSLPPAADEVDNLLDRVFEGPQPLDEGTRAALDRYAEQVVPVLLGMVYSHHLVDGPSAEPRAVAGAIRWLALLRRHEVVERLVELAAAPGIAREVAREAKEALERLGGVAVDGVSEYLRRTGSPSGGATLASILAQMPRSEKTFRVLLELFQRLHWEDDGKLAAAAVLAEYGDGRAVQALQQALRDPQLPAGRTRLELEGVVRRLTGQSSGRRKRAAKG